MSFVRYVLIKCDGDGCDDEDFASPDAKTARDQAWRHGWKRINGEDYCPKCAAKRLAPKEKVDNV